MNPLDPRDPKNLLMYGLLFSDDDDDRELNRRQYRPRGNALGYAAVLFGLLLIVLAAAMWH